MATTKTAVEREAPRDASPEQTTGEARAGTAVRSASRSEKPSASRDYSLPLVHARVPERAVDAAFWAALGVTAVIGALDAPLLGVTTAGLFVVRRRHRAHLETGSAEQPG